MMLSLFLKSSTFSHHKINQLLSLTNGLPRLFDVKLMVFILVRLHALL